MNITPSTADTGPAAERFAAYAAQLRYETLPAEVVRNAKMCLVDAIGCAIFGAGLPWSRAVIELVRASNASGGCSVPGFASRLDPRQAALALGAFAHGFELDSLRKPGAGAHPGATVALPAFAVAQSRSRSGRDLVVAIVAGCEASFRIGAATLHTPELDGFHAPGIVGPFGAAVAAGRLMRLAPDRLADALGIAGSCTGGLLAFAKSRQGGMVKRLHLGRAAESGVLAATLAAHGFEGPHGVLEGPFGVLDSFCSRSDPALLMAGLGVEFETLRLCIKRYACHVTAQAPIELVRTLMERHRFTARDISEISIVASAKVASHHNERRPADIMQAQYSLPFSVAVAAWRNPDDPAAFAEDCVDDRDVLDLAARIAIVPGDAKGWGTAVSIALRDGRNISGSTETFRGCPETPFSLDDIADKFRKLTRHGNSPRTEALLATLLDLENVADVAALEL